MRTEMTLAEALTDELRVRQADPNITTAYMPPCNWCGKWHAGACPHVKAIEYHPNGAIKRVEFRG